MNSWNETITLYNKLETADDGAKWYRHIITDCFVKLTQSENRTGSTEKKADTAIIRIPEQPNYLPSSLWLALDDEEKNKCFTINSGDIIIIDKVSDNIDELTNGKRSSDLIAKYKNTGAVIIGSVNINTQLPGAHYHIRGD